MWHIFRFKFGLMSHSVNCLDLGWNWPQLDMTCIKSTKLEIHVKVTNCAMWELSVNVERFNRLMVFANGFAICLSVCLSQKVQWWVQNQTFTGHIQYDPLGILFTYSFIFHNSINIGFMCSIMINCLFAISCYNLISIYLSKHIGLWSRLELWVIK
jgi:presenilin-like A22 family membrane protease